jgi:hypothetical protein
MGFLSVHLYARLSGNKKKNFHRMTVVAHEQLCFKCSHPEHLICGGRAKDILHISKDG